jgi:hypothetical protein
MTNGYRAGSENVRWCGVAPKDAEPDDVVPMEKSSNESCIVISFPPFTKKDPVPGYDLKEVPCSESLIYFAVCEAKPPKGAG